MVTNIILAVVVVLLIALFITYAFYVERRHLESQSDFDERVAVLSESYESRLERKEKTFQVERDGIAVERGKYVLEMMAVYKEKDIDGYYENHISVPDTPVKLKQVAENEDPEEEIYYEK